MPRAHAINEGIHKIQQQAAQAGADSSKGRLSCAPGSDCGLRLEAADTARHWL
jgi:hypothetical protein